MNKTFLLACTFSVLLVGCGKQEAYEKQPFPDLSEQVEVNNTQSAGSPIIFQTEEVISPDGIVRPPEGPIGSLNRLHPELFE